MSQINVNVPPEGPNPGRMEASHDRTTAAGINLITVLIVLAVLAALVWYLLTGPLHGLIAGTTATTNYNVTVNTPTQVAPAGSATSAAKP